MNWLPKSGRWAYGSFAAICLLVVGVLAWATGVSLRLEQKQRTEEQHKAYENSVRLAINQMESWANPILFSEYRRDYADYAPIFVPNEVRLRSGETLAPGAVVQLSSLLTQSLRHDWFLLHFQVSPEGVFSSPQIPPLFARNWPGVSSDADYPEWETYETRLAALAYSFARGDLVRDYEEKRGQLPLPDESLAMVDGDATVASSLSDKTARKMPVRCESYQRRRYMVHKLQSQQTPRTVCAPEQVATAHLTTFHIHEVAVANEDEDTLIGISYENMVPLWTKLPGRETQDLMFLRALDANGDRVLQGFIVDWPQFKTELLAQVTDLFPKADMEIIDGTDESPDDTVLSLVPARFVPNEPEIAIAGMVWSDTHWFILFGWCGSAVLLSTLGLGLRSMLRLSERRSQFAYAVTHELRTPLTTFQLYTDMLANGLVADESRQEYLETLNDESRRLSGLVSGVLEHSRIESESVPVSKEPVPVAEILREVRDAMEPACAKSGATLSIEDKTPDTQVVTDRQLTVQIIGNLIDNACKYGRNGESAQVSVKTNVSEGRCAIEVSDQGPGVPTRLRNAIFKPYQRGDQHASTITGGIGLGLALSRSWAKLLGGQLELVPSENNLAQRNQGARFRLTLEATS